MKKIFFALIALLPSLLFCEPVSVIVSVAPYLDIVQKIGGDAVTAKMLVPEGVDSHSFEPSPETLKDALKGKIWFTVGECFEARIEAAMRGQKSTIVTYDLRKSLPSTVQDPHIWMSVPLMMRQADYIAKVLQKEIPEASDQIQKNVEALQKELSQLNTKIQKELAPKKGGVIVTAHPSYTLFCSDYGITQLAIEGEGKEPTLQELAALIQKMKKLKIKTIFAQNEYGHKGAEALADDVGATVTYLPDASPRYFEMMERVASAFEKAAVIPE